MRVGSLFSGVGGLDLGLARAGFDHAFFCEFDPFRRTVLARHWPGVPCFEDVRDVGLELAGGRRDTEAVQPAALNGRSRGDCGIDLLAGGFPCQDISVAGQRRGLAGARSGLFFEFARCADALVGPGGWVLVENVPGLLSSNGGRDFAVVLATLADLGFHDLAWRVLDSRYFGVPQRRRRVFVLGRRASGGCARSVLLEPESGGGDFAAGREARTRVAAPLTRGSSGAGVSEPGRRQEDDTNIVNALDRRRGGADDNEAQAGQLVAGTVRSHMRPGSNDAGGVVAGSITRRGGKGPDSDVSPGQLVAGTLKGHTGKGGSGIGPEDTFIHGAPADPDGVRTPPGDAGRLDDPGGAEPRAFNWQEDDVTPKDYSPPLSTDGQGEIAVTGGGSQGTAIDPKPDGPRYAACGDAVTASVAQWIGERLLAEVKARAEKEEVA